MVVLSDLTIYACCVVRLAASVTCYQIEGWLPRPGCKIKFFFFLVQILIYFIMFFKTFL